MRCIPPEYLSNTGAQDSNGESNGMQYYRCLHLLELSREGGRRIDFETGNKNLAQFQVVQEEQNVAAGRPGPYIGRMGPRRIPPYLLKIPDIKLRCMDQRYIAAAERYMKRLAAEMKPWLVTSGGPTYGAD